MKKIDQSKCKHRFSVSGVLGFVSKTLRCNRCGFEKEVSLTRDEARQMKAQYKSEKLEMKCIHSLGWAYQNAFYKWDKKLLTAKQLKEVRRTAAKLNRMYPKKGRRWPVSKFSVTRDGFRYSGFEMMEKMRKFAQRHPEVVLCRCDDDSHCGSTMAFIPHRSKNQYWGTTVVCIPQYGKVTELFFYPEHAVAIEKALAAFNKEWRAKKKLNVEEGYWPEP